MTTLADALASLVPSGVGGESGWRGVVPDNWLQGRTAYGGFSAALALHVAKASDPGLPPLRSAQIAFIGPLAGEVTVMARRLRRGRNAAFVQADVTSDAGLGLRATFVFMAPLESEISHGVGVAPDVTAPDPDAPSVRAPPGVVFAQNFSFVERRDPAADRMANGATWLRWGRLRERDGLDPEVELIAVADGLPPAALRLAGRPAPVSSMTWQLNLIGPPVTSDGWWLLRATSDHARAGFSSQAMTIWNASGEPVAEQTQGVAIFV
ncbi:MAG: thioesterase family protein [Janthinobacterium lividum]